MLVRRFFRQGGISHQEAVRGHEVLRVHGAMELKRSGRPLLSEPDEGNLDICTYSAGWCGFYPLKYRYAPTIKTNTAPEAATSVQLQLSRVRRRSSAVAVLKVRPLIRS